MTDDAAALSVLAGVWAQMRVIRLVVLVVSSKIQLSAWLHGSNIRTGILRKATLAAQLACVAFPGPTAFAASLATTLALGWAQQLPYEVDNSGTLGLLLDLNLFVGVAWAWATGHDVHAGWTAAQPAARSIFATTYVFAALAKLNDDYVDVCRSSCTVFTLLVGDAFVPAALTRRVLALIGDRGMLTLLKAQLHVLAALELSIPLLLAWAPPLTAATIVWAFHLALGSVAYDYSTLAVASLVACAPPAQVQHLAWLSTTPTARVAATAAAVLGCLRLEVATGRELGSPEHLVAIAWLCVLYPALWLADDTPTPAGLFAALAAGDVPLVPAVGGAALLVATVANGLGPYLGYKTVATWAMFSNLHTEGGRSNHWLLPASWQPSAAFVRTLVTVEATDVDLLRSYHTVSRFNPAEAQALSPLQAFAARTGCDLALHANSVLGRGGATVAVFPYRVPWWQLRRMVSVEVLPTRRDFFVEYSSSLRSGGARLQLRRRFEVRGGKIVAGSDPRLARPPPLLLQKLVSFKSVLVDDRDCGVCHGP